MTERPADHLPGFSSGAEETFCLISILSHSPAQRKWNTGGSQVGEEEADPFVPPAPQLPAFLRVAQGASELVELEGPWPEGCKE